MGRVLIIDDNVDMLSLLRMFFERRTAHQVTLARTGKEGLQKAHAEEPDFALVDVMMPGMDGYEVVRRLRADPRTRDMGIVILTARGQPVDKEAALQAGADAHLAKPVDMEMLSQTLDDLQSNAMHISTPKSAVIPVLSLRGGVGVSTVAVNLAVIFQRIAPTLLWDLSPNSGHSALFLGLRPTAHWGDYLEDPTQTLKTYLLEHQSGLRVLCAPPIPSEDRWFTESDIEIVLRSLTGAGQLIVVDMPSRITATEKALLAQAHHIVLLTGDDPPSIQTTLATLRLLQPWRDRIVVVHNATSPDQRPNARALQEMMHVPVKVDLPYDPAQQRAMRRGKPLVLLQPQSPLATGLKRTARAALRG